MLQFAAEKDLDFLVQVEVVGILKGPRGKVKVEQHLPEEKKPTKQFSHPLS